VSRHDPIGNRKLTLFAVYDLIHVSEIHNATIPSSTLLTPSVLHQLQTRADQHEWGLAYNTTSPIRAISGAVLAAQILQSLNATLTTGSLKLGIQFGAYGTFMAFFGLAQLPAASDDFTGIVDYASSFALELVTNSTAKLPAAADVSVRFLFSNGSAGIGEAGLAPFPLFGGKETLLPWATFAEQMGKFALGDTSDWCKACGNTAGVCATASVSSSGSGSSGSGDSAGDSGSGGVSKPVAGVIGAVVALVVVLALEGLVMAVAGLRVIKKRGFGKGSQADDQSTSTK
jgi:hypothetical protein